MEYDELTIKGVLEDYDLFIRNYNKTVVADVGDAVTCPVCKTNYTLLVNSNNNVFIAYDTNRCQEEAHMWLTEIESFILEGVRDNLIPEVYRDAVKRFKKTRRAYKR